MFVWKFRYWVKRDMRSVPVVLLWSGLILHDVEEITQNPFMVLARVECDIIYWDAVSLQAHRVGLSR